MRSEHCRQQKDGVGWHAPERHAPPFTSPRLSGRLFGIITSLISALRVGLVATIASALLMAVPARADVNSELNRFWNGLGATSNFTGPTAFQGQAASYYTGGSLRVRTTSRNARLGTFQLPSVEAGCGGIDIFSGSLSFISKDELVQLSKAIAANSVGFAFDLALETLSPVLAETMKDLRSRLQALTQANINSCEAAEALVMGVFPKAQRASAAVCARLGVKQGRFTDYAAARHGCGQQAFYDQTKAAGKAAKGTDASAAAWPDNINIAWAVLRGSHNGASDWLQNDKATAELLMGMTGTIIIKGGDVKAYPGFGTDDKFIDWFINGGTSKLTSYICIDADDCLSMGGRTATLPEARSFKGRVSKEVDGLITAIQTDTPASPKQIALVNRTSLPLYRILNVYAAYSGPILDTQRALLVDAVAFDLAIRHIRELVAEIRKRAGASPLVGQDMMTHWLQRLDHLTRALNEQQHDGTKAYEAALKINERIRLIEAQLSSRFGNGFGETARWNTSASAGD